MKHGENVIVYDAEESELLPLLEGVNASAPCAFELLQRPENIALNRRRSGALDELKRYFNYFRGGFALFLHRKEYKRVICWQQFYALTFGFFLNVFHVKKTCQVIALNYTYKEKGGVAKKPYYWFMKKCIAGGTVDYLHVPSNLYADRIAQEFHYDRNKIIVRPFGITDAYDKLSKFPPPDGLSKDGYFLSIGRSNRDYDFLVRVWEGIQFPLVIISDKYKKDCANPYVTVRNDVGGNAQYAWINNCKANIICLDDGNLASGDTVLLTSMSLEKLVIVSSPSTLAEMYVKDGENGLCVKKNEEDFRTTIKDVLAGKYEGVGKAARQSFLARFSRRRLGEEIGKYVQ